ncbi:hypothetical protein EDC45_0490 [Mesocricetibacter intestinalis]|uniref:Sel1 repeat-containing protein n=1 Tax=Mesocricetibacter intestinalis TaxID=1521930 RepID=A0A4R6VC03_9PAST|nr:tetratricopeptide repeat protein [Mesocricetibacter intestinalis]TDQ59828.1 hypothetical protein EDC45_0490 [Mesocricetibacter intestinalis]
MRLGFLVLLCCAFGVQANPLSGGEKGVDNQAVESLNLQGPSDDELIKNTQQAANKGDWQSVHRNLLALAQRGNAAAQVNLGVLYITGRGTQKDTEQAYWWFNEAAEKGSVKAVTYLGMMYLDGLGVKKDTDFAIKILQRAANIRYPQAMTMLGNAYYRKNNLNSSFTWFERAAKAGDGEAQFKLGVMYERGEGTRPNRAKAIHWYRQSAKSDTESAAMAAARLEELEPESRRP